MRQKDEMERTENARARSNRHILWLTYGIAALFIAMAVYFGWFIQFKSETRSPLRPGDPRFDYEQ